MMFNNLLPDFDDYILNESKIKGVDEVKKSIVFTDIKGSSDLWNTDETKMYNALIEHEDQIFRLSKKYKGLVIKSIGDAFMISFDNLIDSIKFTIDLQTELINTPIKVNKGQISLRIGICYGYIYERKTKRQNSTLIDYFGNVVNTASRLESKVSDVNGFAFAFNYKPTKKETDEILHILDSECDKYKIINFTHNCTDESKKINRSARLLSDSHRFICKDISKLKGVDDIIVYNVTI